MKNFKKDFLLEEGIIFLNHGSFGACPRPVFEVYQDWQHRLELQPVRFLGREALDLLAEARTELAVYLNTQPDNLVYTPNPTTAINMVVRSLDLKPGDEVLTSEHEYGAMDRTWRYICGQSGAKYVHQPIPLPVTTPEEFIEVFLAGITPSTRIIFLSQITSQTALTFPVREICAKARELGILSIIDGAHVPGHIPLDLQDIDADIYTGACHKWLCAPKGSSFLYAHPQIQSRLDPLVVSWGYESDKPGPSQFIDYHEWQGTRDLAAFLAVPGAIQYQRENNWHIVSQRCHDLALQVHSRVISLTGLEPLSPADNIWFQQMVAARLPDAIDHQSLKDYLYDQHQIEVLTHTWQDQPYLRVSFQAYNQQADLDLLLGALEQYLTKEEIYHEIN
jgi:isopenicillin-N epimerase